MANQPRGSPSSSTILRHAKQLHKMMFEGKYYEYKLSDIAILLNKLAKMESAPNDGIPWGDALLGIYSLRDVMKEIGVRGSEEMHNAKKLLIASVVSTDDNDDVPTNRPLLNALLPHIDDHCRAEYLKQCLERRAKFDANGNAQTYCFDIIRKTRDSMAG